jgi:hypothetical protein
MLRGEWYKFSGYCVVMKFFMDGNKKVCGLIAIDPAGSYLIGF